MAKAGVLITSLTHIREIHFQQHPVNYVTHNSANNTNETGGGATSYFKYQHNRTSFSQSLPVCQMCAGQVVHCIEVIDTVRVFSLKHMILMVCQASATAISSLCTLLAFGCPFPS